MTRLSQFIEHLRFEYGPPLARWLIHLSTYRARRGLTTESAIKVLIDNTVLGHATTHETARVSIGQVEWGTQTLETFYTARIPVHSSGSDSREHQNVQYLPGLISLYHSGHARLFTSGELLDEQFRKPSGMFRGYGLCDHNLFAGVRLERIHEIAFPTMGPSWMKLPNAKEQQSQRLTRKAQIDPEFASLLDVLGPKNSQDAWHIRTAEIHECFCFLTMDFKLLRIIDAQRGAPRIRSLKTRVMSPIELGKHLGLPPISPQILSYTNASFPVRTDLCWPDGKRRGRGKRIKEGDAE